MEWNCHVLIVVLIVTAVVYSAVPIQVHADACYSFATTTDQDQQPYYMIYSQQLEFEFADMVQQVSLVYEYDWEEQKTMTINSNNRPWKTLLGAGGPCWRPIRRHAR